MKQRNGSSLPTSLFLAGFIFCTTATRGVEDVQTGASGSAGSDGQSVTATAVSADPNNSATATGGQGGLANAGTGNATATGTGSNVGNAAMFVLVGAGGGNGVNGGNAVATGTANGTTGNASAQVSARGGNVEFGIPSGGLVGTADATATATGGKAFASASANGRSGTAAATANSSGGLVTHVAAHGVAPVKGEGTTGVEATVNQTAKSRNDSFGNVWSFATGLPTGSDVANFTASAPNVAAAINTAGGDEVLGVVAMGAVYNPTLDGLLDEATAAFSVDLSQLTQLRSLKVGLLGAFALNNVFDQVHFTLSREGSDVLIDVTFTDGATAVAYFTDHVLDFGAINTGVTGDLDLAFTMEVATPANSGGLGFDLLFGNFGPAVAITEPSTVGLVLLAGLLAVRLRRGRD